MCNHDAQYFSSLCLVTQSIALVLMQVPGRFREMTREEKQKAGGGSFTVASVVNTCLSALYIFSLLPILLGVHNVQ